MRLGGFDWTVKVGQGAARAAAGIATAPEASPQSKHAHTFESDWYQFGRLLAQLFVGVHEPRIGRPRGTCRLARVKRPQN